MPTHAQSDGEDGADQGMTTPRCPHERPPKGDHKRAESTLPLLQRQRKASVKSEEETASSASPDPLPATAVAKPRRQGKKGPANSLEKHREQLIRLFWVQDLPLRQVQAIMKREHGLDASIKVYNSQFRKWGIRKNIKRHEALELATGQLEDSSSMFWPDNRDVEYAARIDRHLRNLKRRPGSTLPFSQAGMAADAVTPPRRLRGPDTLEQVEAASYYFQMYITRNHEPDTWLRHCPCYGEQGTFSSLFIRGLDRLSRNEQPRLAFKDINQAFDELKQTVTWDHPMVYMRLMDAIAASAQYPKSEICSYICRLLSDHVKRLSLIVHGPNHPLNYAWGEALCVSSGATPQSFILEVAKSLFRKCMARRGRAPLETFDISKSVPSDARGLDETSLRDSLSEITQSSDISKAQETRLALAELLISQNRLAEGCHFYRVAMAFQDDDPVRRASKKFWAAELQWRTGITWGSLDTLKAALECVESEPDEGEESNSGATETMKEEMKGVLRRREYLLASKEKARHIQAGHTCPATLLQDPDDDEDGETERLQDEPAVCPYKISR